MNIACFMLFVFCFGVLVGQDAENPIMNLITILALVGTFSPSFVEFYKEITKDPYAEDEEIYEVEERRPTTRLPYYNRYKP